MVRDATAAAMLPEGDGYLAALITEFRSGCSAPSEVLAKGIFVKPLTGGVP